MKKVKKKNVAPQAEDAVIKTYAERIAELKQMNTDLTLVLEEYRKKEQKIADALAYIEELKTETQKEIKLRYSLESERLTAFRKKWITAVKNGTAKQDFERTEEVLEECRKLLLAEFDSEESRDYLEETERLSAVEKTQKRHVEELSEEELEELLNQLK